MCPPHTHGACVSHSQSVLLALINHSTHMAPNHLWWAHIHPHTHLEIPQTHTNSTLTINMHTRIHCALDLEMTCNQLLALH